MLLQVMGTDISLPGPPIVDMLLPAMGTDISLPSPPKVDTLLQVMVTDICLPGPPVFFLCNQFFYQNHPFQAFLA